MEISVTKFRLKLITVLALVFGLLPCALYAEENSAEIKDDEILKLYNEAVALQEKGESVEASTIFRDLLMRTGANEYHFNIGLCERSLERYDLVYESFSIFLELPKDGLVSEYAPRAEEMRDQALEKIGFINVADDGAPFDVVVDGEQRGAAPLQKPIAALPGEHTVAFVENGNSVFETVVAVVLGETVDVNRPAPEPEVAQPVAVPEQPMEESAEKAAYEELKAQPPHRQTSRLKTAGILLAGTGLATLIAGTVTGQMAISKNDKLKDECANEKYCESENKDLKKEVDRLALSTDILLATGTAMAVTGVILAIAGHKRNRLEEKVSMKATPLIGNTVMGIAFQGGF